MDVYILAFIVTALSQLCVYLCLADHEAICCCLQMFCGVVDIVLHKCSNIHGH